MKRIAFFAALLIATLSANAQWEKKIESQTSATEVAKSSKKSIDPKYMQGAAPEVNGKVTWEQNYDVPGKTAAQIYDRMFEYMQQFVKGENMTELSKVAVANKAKYQIGVRAQEWLTFAKKFLNLDRTKFAYTLQITCTDGKCNVKLTNILYHYEEERPTAALYTAEEIISDNMAFNKKGTDFVKGGTKKFRINTIDRKDAIFSEIGEVLK